MSEFDFPVLVGLVAPWVDKENIPEGWQVVDALRGWTIVENPGDPRSPARPGVWIVKIDKEVDLAV